METKQPTIVWAEDVPQQDFRPIPWHVNAHGSDIGALCHYSAHWNFTKEPEPEVEGVKKVRKVGHPPHMHKENEIIMLIGSNPEDPYDLGATIEFCFGPNMEKHVFTRSATIVIPGGTPHGFFNTIECHRPYMFIEVQEANSKTEKFLWEYLSEEELASVDRSKWNDVGFDD